MPLSQRSLVQHTLKASIPLLAGLVLAVSASGPATAQISGFNSGANFTLNGSGTAVPAFTTADTLHLTNQNSNEASSAFDNTLQNVTAFTASFTYTYGGTSSGDPGDGVAFVLENDPAGASALGTGGGDLGYTGIANSAAIELDVSPVFNGPGTAYYTQGQTAQTQNTSYIPTGSVVLNSGDPIAVLLSYNGTSLTEQLTDAAAQTSFTQVYAADIPAAVGGSTAFVGFTGGTGSENADQSISNFTFTPNAPVPEASTTVSFGLLLALGLSGVMIAARKKKVRAGA